MSLSYNIIDVVLQISLSLTDIVENRVTSEDELIAVIILVVTFRSNDLIKFVPEIGLPGERYEILLDIESRLGILILSHSHIIVKKVNETLQIVR